MKATRWVPVGRPVRVRNVLVDGKLVAGTWTLQQLQPAGSPPPRTARPVSVGALKR